MVDIRRLTSIIKIDVGGQVLILSEEQAEALCEEIERTLYDEPTYQDLDREVTKLKIENEELRNELMDLSQVGKYDRIMRGGF